MLNITNINRRNVNMKNVNICLARTQGVRFKAKVPRLNADELLVFQELLRRQWISEECEDGKIHLRPY